MTQVLVRGRVVSCPDDPARVSDRGYFPHESTGDLETIENSQAALEIAHALANNTPVYGLSADVLAEDIANLHFPELRDLVLAAMFPGLYPKQSDRARARIFKRCGELANRS